MNRRAHWIGSFWPVFLVFALAVALRCFMLGEWSLWEDEETSIYFSLRPERPFPSCFPLFFWALHGVFRLAGVSVATGRIFAAAVAVGSIVLSFVFLRRWVSRPVALVATLLLAINLGHLFWSQSIRYYTMVLVFQLLSMYWFLDGFERGRYGTLLLSNLALVCALLTHYSAGLLAPVYIAYLGMAICRGESEGGYDRNHYLVFGLPFVVILAVFAGRIVQMQSLMSGWAVTTSQRNPLHLLLTVTLYFGVPVIGLGLLAPLVARKTPNRIVLFLLLTGVLPVLELAVIAQLNVTNVAWYYGFVSLVGFAGLAAICLVALYERRRRLTPALLGSATVLYYSCFLVAYYTTMHGDRPRWEEASHFLRRAANVTLGNDTPQVFAEVPGIVAYYLGVDPSQTMVQSRIQRLPDDVPTEELPSETWYVLEARFVTGDYADWFAERGTLESHFEARTGPVDRSVVVYRCRPRSPVARLHDPDQ